MEHATVTVLSEKLSRMLKKFPDAVLARTSDIMTQWQIYELEKQVQLGLAGLDLNRRTGHLSRGVRFSKVVTSTLGEAEVKVSMGVLPDYVPYAMIQETGGTIKSKGKLLTVPTRYALTTAGVTKKPAPEWKNTFVIKTKSGNLLIMQNRKHGEVVPLFVLRKSVKIPASHWASNAVKRSLPKLQTEIKTMDVNAIIKKSTG